MEPCKRRKKRKHTESQKEDKGGFREKYKEGVDLYYTDNGSAYINPHEVFMKPVLKDIIDSWIKPLYPEQDLSPITVFDLACGSGEAALVFQEAGAKHITGCDPYTFEAFTKRTGLPVRKDTFLDISKGSLGLTKTYDVIVCSYALHLAPVSLMSQLCLSMALVAEYLFIVSPHKFPLMREEYGWELLHDTTVTRVHCRLFKSKLLATNYS